MRYWIFQCNPKRYDIDGRLAEGESEISWLVTRYKNDIAPGDLAFIWQAGPHRGVRAIMRVESAPGDLVDRDLDAQYWSDPGDKRLACRVQGTLIARFSVAGVDEIRAVPGLRDLSILRVPQGTNFAVSQEEAGLLLKLLRRTGKIPPEFDVRAEW